MISACLRNTAVQLLGVTTRERTNKLNTCPAQAALMAHIFITCQSLCNRGSAPSETTLTPENFVLQAMGHVPKGLDYVPSTGTHQRHARSRSAGNVAAVADGKHCQEEGCTKAPSYGWEGMPGGKPGVAVMCAQVYEAVFLTAAVVEVYVCLRCAGTLRGKYVAAVRRRYCFWGGGVAGTRCIVDSVADTVLASE